MKFFNKYIKHYIYFERLTLDGEPRTYEARPTNNGKYSLYLLSEVFGPRQVFSNESLACIRRYIEN